MDLFELNGRVVVNLADAVKAFDEIQKEGQQTESKLGKFFKGIGNGAVVAGKAIATGLAAGATAMGALTIKALNLTGELEQNMGGSEAVFKEYAESMQETAKQAFSNMGLSTSDFLGTANKMGALFQGAGFDIKTSADMSAKAMQRAADVASIMGIDTASAMEAIAGAAKGNFTMMDNLGVAMNDTAIQNYALSKGIEKSTSEMTQQEKIGLAMEMFLEKTAYAAGNYTKENETLAGSLGTAKAALKNFLDGSGDVDQLVSSFSNAAEVIIKNLGEIAPRLISGLSELVSKVTPMIPGLLSQMLPIVIEGAVSLVNGLISALPMILNTLFSAIMSAAPQLLGVVGNLLSGVADFIMTNLPIITEKAQDIVGGLGQKIKENLPTLISKGLDMLLGLSESILTNLPTLVATGMDLIMSLVQGIIAALPEIIAKAPQIIINFANSISGSMQTIFTKGLQIVWELIKGIIGAIPDLVKNFPKIIEAIFAVWNAINWMNLGKKLISGIGNGIKNMGSSLKNTANNLFGKLNTLISNIFKSIGNAIMHPINTAKALFTGAVSAIKNFATSGFNALKSSVSNIFSSIKNAITNPIQTAKNTIKGIIDAIKGFFNFKINWPKVPMPKFGITPDGWQIGDLLKGSIPKLSIKWNAKGAIMKEPTLFGYNPATGTFQGGGEAGDEAIAPISTLQQYVKSAVASENTIIVTRLDRIIELLVRFFPEMLEALDLDMYLDGDVLVAETANRMDKELGKIAIRKGRGR